MSRYLHLGISPPRDLDYHIQHRLLVIGIEWNIVERGDHNSILLNVDAVLQGIGSTNLPCSVGIGRTHLGLLLGEVEGGEVSGKLLRPKWGFSERRGLHLVGLQNGEKIREFAFTVPNGKISIRFDIKIPHARRPEYRVLVYL